MTLRKIIFDNSVKHIPKSEQTKVRDDKPNIKKITSLSRKQDKKNHKTKKTH